MVRLQASLGKQTSIENAVNIAGALGTLAVAGPVIGGIVVGTQVILSGVQSTINQNLERRKSEFDNARLGVISKKWQQVVLE